MSKYKDGGPAFPFPSSSEAGWHGMTLRDWFAGQALAGYCSRADLDRECVDGYAKCAYMQADAMLAAREGKK